MLKVLSSIFVFIVVTQYSNLAFPVSIKIPYIRFSEKEEDKMLDKDKAPDNSRENKESVDLSQPLTLKQCVQIAITQSPTMRTAKMNLSEEELNVQDAQSSYLPEVGVSGGYTFSDNIDFGWEKENYDASLDASYTIWDHGKRKSALAQAKARREGEQSRYMRSMQSLIFEVTQAYYSLLEAEKIIAVDEQLLEQSKQNVEKVKAFVEAGSAIEADIATARVQQANSELTLLNDMNNLDLAKANLALIMGFDPATEIMVIDDPDYEKYVKTGLIETEDIFIDDMKSQAFALRPELKEQKTNQDILKLAAELAALERYPRITAESHYNLRVDDYLRERDALKNYKSWDVMTRLSFPIFDGGRSLRTVKKAEIALRKSDESMFELEQNISLEVRQSYLSFERSKKSLDIASVQVEDAKLSLDIVQSRYDLDEAILLELLDAQAQYASSRINQVKAFYNYKLARKSLEKAMGVIQ